MESIYIETSVISYLVAKPSNNLITAARQKITYDWWNNKRHKYNIFISELVVAEAIKGDKLAAQERLNVIKNTPVLEINNGCIELANLFF